MFLLLNVEATFDDQLIYVDCGWHQAPWDAERMVRNSRADVANISLENFNMDGTQGLYIE